MDGGRVPLDLSGMLDFYLVLSFFCAVLGGKRCHVQYVVHFRANSIVHSPILDKTVNSLCWYVLFLIVLLYYTGNVASKKFWRRKSRGLCSPWFRSFFFCCCSILRETALVRISILKTNVNLELRGRQFPRTRLIFASAVLDVTLRSHAVWHDLLFWCDTWQVFVFAAFRSLTIVLHTKGKLNGSFFLMWLFNLMLRVECCMMCVCCVVVVAAVEIGI